MKTLLLTGLMASCVTGIASADILYSQGFEDESLTGSKYYDTGSSADGDYVGVTEYAGDVGTFYEGSQGYQMSDTDGVMSLISDEFAGANFITLALYISATGYENVDWVSVTMGGVELFSIGGTDDDGAAMEAAAGVWFLVSGAVNGGSLDISFASNSGSEELFIDAISIEGSAVPSPGALALLGLAGIAARRRRR